MKIIIQQGKKKRKIQQSLKQIIFLDDIVDYIYYQIKFVPWDEKKEIFQEIKKIYNVVSNKKRNYRNVERKTST